MRKDILKRRFEVVLLLNGPIVEVMKVLDKLMDPSFQVQHGMFSLCCGSR